MSQSDYEEAFRRFLDDPGELRHAVPWAKEHGALPIDEDGGVVAGLTRDGRVLAHHHDPFPGQVPYPDREIVDPTVKESALEAGARRFPWLASWRPQRT